MRTPRSTTPDALKKAFNDIETELATLRRRASGVVSVTSAVPLNDNTERWVATTISYTEVSGGSSGVPSPVIVASIPLGAVVTCITWEATLWADSTLGMTTCTLDPTTIALSGGSGTAFIEQLGAAKSAFDLMTVPSPDNWIAPVTIKAGTDARDIEMNLTWTGNAPDSGTLTTRVKVSIPGATTSDLPSS